jgi:hypothetical protein
MVVILAVDAMIKSLGNCCNNCGDSDYDVIATHTFTRPERNSSSRSSAVGSGTTCEYEGGRWTKPQPLALRAASDENTDESRAS